jgi:methionyl-tRNA formyltransferase
LLEESSRIVSRKYKSALVCRDFDIELFSRRKGLDHQGCTFTQCVKIPTMSERIVFMGSPDFAVPTLRYLAQHYHVLGVITQPDRPAGRGKVMSPPAVKVAAKEYGLDILQPNRLKDEWVIERLKSWNPDAIVVAAFGMILRQNILELPKFGCINVHASLLPRWRGAAPIQAAILAGDTVSGITIMQMDAGIDTGGIFKQREIPIEAQDTTESLSTRLAEAGAALLGECLPEIFTGTMKPYPQDETKAIYAPKIEKQSSGLVFTEPAEKLARRVRAYSPWPGSQIMIGDLAIKILQARAISSGILAQGTRGIVEGFPAIGTCEGDLVIEELQPAGKKPMNGKVFLNGFRHWVE